MNRREPPEHEDIIYRIDDLDRICFVNQRYDEFAHANMGMASSSKIVLHRPIWDFITDPTTQEIYKQTLLRIRQGRQFRFNFRCDSPVYRRMMEIQISPGESGIVEFRTRILAERQHLYEPLPENTPVGAKHLLRMCSWCKKIDINSRWVEMEDAVLQLGIFERPPLQAITITHGICKPCHQTALDSLQQ